MLLESGTSQRLQNLQCSGTAHQRRSSGFLTPGRRSGRKRGRSIAVGPEHAAGQAAEPRPGGDAQGLDQEKGDAGAEVEEGETEQGLGLETEDSVGVDHDQAAETTPACHLTSQEGPRHLPQELGGEHHQEGHQGAAWTRATRGCRCCRRWAGRGRG